MTESTYSYADYAQARRRGVGMQLLESLHAASQAAGASPEQLARDFGLRTQVIKDHLFAYRRVQPCRALAKRLDIELEVLVLVGKAVHGLRNPRVVQREFLAQLLHAVAGEHIDQAARIINNLAAEANRGTEGTLREEFHVAKHADRDGMFRFLGKMRPETAALLNARLHPHIVKLRKQQPQLSYAEARFTLMCQATVGAQPGEPLAHPTFIIPVDPTSVIEQGYIATAEGARVPLEDAINQRLSGTGFAVLTQVDAESGAFSVGAIRPIAASGRFASAEQRLGQVLANLVCSHPDCSRAAVTCQIHHLIAWSEGGQTVDQNLRPLCAKHNGANDDDRSRVRNGYIDVDELGFVGHRLSPDDPLRYQENPVVQLGARMLTYRHYQRYCPPDLRERLDRAIERLQE